MKIRQKLTLLFTILFAVVLLVFVLMTYFSYAENREDYFFKRLEQRAIAQANLLLDAGIAPQVLQLIYRNVPHKEEVAIYDTAFHLLYHDGANVDRVKETPQMIRNIITEKHITFYIKKSQVVGFLYHHKGKDYVITAVAQDFTGLQKLNTLLITLVTGYVIAIVLTLIAGKLFSQKALQPVSDMVDKVEEITATNLHMRIDEGNRKDEIAVLAITFNRVLNRLEQSFDAQKQFVSNISHELRTPLSTLIAELELSTIKPRSEDTYREIIARTLSDAHKLARLCNDLLDLARASYDHTEIKFKTLRLDEVLMDARLQVIQSNATYRVPMLFETDIEDDKLVTVHGNEYLLKVAFANLIDNGCKFSPDHHCTITINTSGNDIIIRLADKGIGIGEEDLPHIFTPFYRGSNKKYADGNGIGLSLTDRIIKLHNGNITIQSQKDQGSTFEIRLPHL